LFRFRHLYIYLRLQLYSVSGPQDPSPQVVPTFHFIPSYALMVDLLDAGADPELEEKKDFLA
jgi:hypothetical protein